MTREISEMKRSATLTPDVNDNSDALKTPVSMKYIDGTREFIKNLGLSYNRAQIKYDVRNEGATAIVPH